MNQQGDKEEHNGERSTQSALDAFLMLARSLSTSVGAYTVLGVVLLLGSSGNLKIGTFHMEIAGDMPDVLRIALIGLGVLLILCGLLLVIQKKCKDKWVRGILYSAASFFMLAALIGLARSLIIGPNPLANAVQEWGFDPVTNDFYMRVQANEVRRYVGKALLLAVCNRDSERTRVLGCTVVGTWSAELGDFPIHAVVPPPAHGTSWPLGSVLEGHLCVLPPTSVTNSIQDMAQVRTLKGRELLSKWVRTAVKEASVESCLYVFSQLGPDAKDLCASRIAAQRTR